MDLMKTDYEFLDLSDVKEAELNKLQCALYERIPKISATGLTGDWNESTIDRSSCSSSSVGRGTVSSSVDSLSGGECEMAPHSPARAPHAPPPYAQPPPAYPPHAHWPVAPPNVYVSQVTANVNVHGYMGQYYSPQQYAPHAPAHQPAAPHAHAHSHPAHAHAAALTGGGGERSARPPRRDRRTKRAPSPPHQPPPYYLQYPQYYPAAQAQGAPLYHLPVYQPLVYPPYAYPPYYPDYPMPVEGDPDKGPDEYQQEVVMEQEAVDAYYAGAHYVAPPYGPPVDGPLEYLPPVYLPPPHHAPAPLPQPPPPAPPAHSTPHQFNVHAKNFVQGQSQRTYTPPEKPQDQKTSQPPVAPSASASASTSSIDNLPIKDLKISKGPSSPKQSDQSVEPPPKPPSPGEKAALNSPKTDAPKTTWVAAETKIEANITGQTPATKTFPVAAPSIGQMPAAAKISPPAGKALKGPAAPFSGGKQPTKPAVPQTVVPVQQAASTPKAPFGSRQKRDAPPNRSPSNENNEASDKSTPVVEHVKREPPLPPSKAPMPISITLHSTGAPLIVSNKAPFGHSRKGPSAPEPPPVPQPPPPAPTASDFPPPPTPRNRGEPAPPPVVPPQPQPAPGKSWASLFSSKVTGPAPSVAPAPLSAPVAVAAEEPTSPTATNPPAVTSVQKPVAKVPPFDASPLQTAALDKSSPAPRPATVAPLPLSYSEKTSVNATAGGARPAPAVSEPREVAPQKEPAPAAPLQPSPFSDDPNSYRMGEFLAKYQLDNRPVALLPRGLTNRSNFCYVNAILQALIACPPFYNMLKALPYQTRRGKSSTPVIDSLVELCYEFSPLSSVGRTGRGSNSAGSAGAPAVPAGPPLEGGAGQRVLRALRPFPGSQEGRQEDAEEFLGCLLNSLNDEMLELMKLVEGPEPPTPAPATGASESDDDDSWKVMGPRNRGAVERRWAARRTPVADIFRGRTRLRLHRAPHHDVTDAVQPFFTLQLDIERANSVKDALELLAGKDTLEGVSDAWQQLSLEQLPAVLLLHLKCFQLDAEGHTAKIVKNIDYPIDLKIDPKIMSSKLKYTSKQRMYKLFAVVYHEGVEAVKGHYLTDTFHGQVGWIRYDDSTVTQVGEGAVLKPKAPRMPYLLMYRRHDSLPAPRAAPSSAPAPSRD